MEKLVKRRAFFAKISYKNSQKYGKVLDNGGGVLCYNIFIIPTKEIFMGFIRWAFKDYIQDGQKAKSVPGLIFKMILFYVLTALFIGVVAVISFFCGLIPVVGWLVSILCWILNIIAIIFVLISIPGYVIMFLAYFKVIK